MGRKQKYTIDDVKKVITLVNDSKMSKSQAMTEAGFKNRQSYYYTLLRYGYEEQLSIKRFKFSTNNKSKISFLN